MQSKYVCVYIYISQLWVALPHSLLAMKIHFSFKVLLPLSAKANQTADTFYWGANELCPSTYFLACLSSAILHKFSLPLRYLRNHMAISCFLLCQQHSANLSSLSWFHFTIRVSSQKRDSRTLGVCLHPIEVIFSPKIQLNTFFQQRGTRTFSLWDAM